MLYRCAKLNREAIYNWPYFIYGERRIMHREVDAKAFIHWSITENDTALQLHQSHHS